MKKNPPKKPSKRAYKSEIRAQQAELTRHRILEAAVRVATGRHADLSFKAIAKEAGVSTPTVYRHFPTRDDLFQAVFHHYDANAGAMAEGDVDGEELEQLLRDLFVRLAEQREESSRLNTLWEFSRATTVPARRNVFERLVDQRIPGLQDPHRTWLVDLSVVLASSAIAEAFDGYLDVAGNDVADRVLFALDALYAHAATLKEEEPS